MSSNYTTADLALDQLEDAILTNSGDHSQAFLLGAASLIAAARAGGSFEVAGAVKKLRTAQALDLNGEPTELDHGGPHHLKPNLRSLFCACQPPARCADCTPQAPHLRLVGGGA